MDRLDKLHDAGVSIWLDTLSRDLLDSGEFSRLVTDRHVTGATSNPTIFAPTPTSSTSSSSSHPASSTPCPEQPSTPSPTTARPGPHNAEPDDLLDKVARADVDLDRITDELEREGVKAFSDSYRQLLACIVERVGELDPTPAGTNRRS